MLTFHKATNEHLHVLKDLSQRVIRNNYTHFLGVELVDGFIQSGASDAEIDAGIDFCTVASLDSAIIGFYIIKGNLLHLIMVDVPFQRNGYGTEMLRQVEAHVFLHSQRIHLQSFGENTVANNFYLKNGYRLTDTAFADGIGKNMVCFARTKVCRESLRFNGGAS